MHPDYLEKILNAQVYDVAVETPLDAAPNLSARLGNTILFKREDMQPVFSFKLRGAYNKIARLSPEKLKRGVICASAGNHAQGVALSAAKIGCRAVIVMPTTTPQIKIDAVQSRGGEVVLAGESYDEAYAHALELEKREKLTFVHPFDDPEVIAGQGTIGMEILRQHPKPIHAVFCAIGGGGLISGVAAYIKRLRPETKIIGVETVDADAMAQSLAAGKRVRLKQVGLFADGAAVKYVGEETFRLCQQYVDEVVRVDTDAVCAAIKDVFEDTRAVLEPAGALAVAGAKAYAARRRLKNRTLVAVATAVSKTAAEAGFDVIEIHGAHGYLLSQFMSPLFNRREDAYGGNFEKRMRVPVEVIRGIRKRLGPDFPLFFRCSVEEYLPGGITLELARDIGYPVIIKASGGGGEQRAGIAPDIRLDHPLHCRDGSARGSRESRSRRSRKKR